MSEKKTAPESTSSIVDQVAKADKVAEKREKNVPKKVRKIIKKYNKSEHFAPFSFAIDYVNEGVDIAWADMSEKAQKTAISISRVIEEWA